MGLQVMAEHFNALGQEPMMGSCLGINDYGFASFVIEREQASIFENMFIFMVNNSFRLPFGEKKNCLIEKR